MVMIVIEDGRDDGCGDGPTTLITWYGSPTSSYVNFLCRRLSLIAALTSSASVLGVAVLNKEFRSRPGAPSI
jgi:hypothetical protein